MYFHGIGAPGSHSLCGVPIEKADQEILRDASDVTRVVQRGESNPFEELFSVAGIVGRQTRKHLEHNGSE